MSEQDKHWMAYALNLAAKAGEQGEVPVGAVLIREGEILGEGWNQPITLHDPSAHAEMLALRMAGHQDQQEMRHVEASKSIENERLLSFARTCRQPDGTIA